MKPNSSLPSPSLQPSFSLFESTFQDFCGAANPQCQQRALTQISRVEPTSNTFINIDTTHQTFIARGCFFAKDLPVGSSLPAVLQFLRIPLTLEKKHQGWACLGLLPGGLAGYGWCLGRYLATEAQETQLSKPQFCLHGWWTWVVLVGLLWWDFETIDDPFFCGVFVGHGWWTFDGPFE